MYSRKIDLQSHGQFWSRANPVHEGPTRILENSWFYDLVCSQEKKERKTDEESMAIPIVHSSSVKWTQERSGRGRGRTMSVNECLLQRNRCKKWDEVLSFLSPMNLITYLPFKNNKPTKPWGTSLVVKWLRLLAPNAGDLGFDSWSGN